MADGIVLQLQAEALDESVDIETLLRKAYLVAKKLGLSEFEEWISQEQNGYHKDVPNYRMIGGKIKAWNPYYGWTPVVMDGKIADQLSQFSLGQPISAIADAYKNSDGTVSYSVSGSLSEFLNENADGIPTQYSFFSSSAELHRILSAVRNKLLEWSIILEKNGIIGEGLCFTDVELKTALESSVINNYTNNFFSSTGRTQIQQGGESNNQ